MSMVLRVWIPVFLQEQGYSCDQEGECLWPHRARRCPDLTSWEFPWCAGVRSRHRAGIASFYSTLSPSLRIQSESNDGGGSGWSDTVFWMFSAHALLLVDCYRLAPAVVKTPIDLHGHWLMVCMRWQWGRRYYMGSEPCGIAHRGSHRTEGILFSTILLWVEYF